MQSLHSYTDYREWLKDWFQERKTTDAWFSYRWLGTRLEIDPGYLSHIVHGNAHLAEADLPALAKEAKLSKQELEYLQELVRFNKAKRPREIAERFARLSQMKALQATTLDDRQCLFFSRWHHMAVRLAISLERFDGDWEALAGRMVFPMAVEDLKESAALLEELQLVRRLPDGGYELTDRFVSSGDSWKSLAVRAYQLQSLEMASRALLELPKDDRDISTVSLTLPASDLPLLQEKVRDFRQSLLRWSAGHDNCDTAYQVNVQIFPMAKVEPVATEGGIALAPKSAAKPRASKAGRIP